VGRPHRAVDAWLDLAELTRSGTGLRRSERHLHAQTMRRVMRRRPGPIRRAPWSRHLKTEWLAGAAAYELQLGPVVIQWFYCRHEKARLFGHLHIWRDPYWRS
jgi:hypothetical protein